MSEQIESHYGRIHLGVSRSFLFGLFRPCHFVLLLAIVRFPLFPHSNLFAQVVAFEIFFRDVKYALDLLCVFIFKVCFPDQLCFEMF